MSGPSYPGGYPTDPSNQPGYPQYPQQPQQPYTQPPGQPPAYPPGQPPAYPPYGYPPAYPPYVQPPRQGGDTGRVFLILGIIAAVLIVACIGLCATVFYSSSRFFGTALGTAASQISTQEATQLAGAPVQTATNFCVAVSNQEYTSAYSYLSSSLQQQYSQTQFTQDNQTHDRTLGKVTACTPQGAPSVNGSEASLTVMVTRTLAPTPNSAGTATPTQTASATGQITLILDSNGTWVISNIDSSLNML